MTSRDVCQPEFWNDRYEEGKTPWDYHGVPQALLSYMQKGGPRGRVLVPGCGSGYEVQVFLSHGHDVIGIDFAPAAVTRAQALLEERDRHRILQADFFLHPFDRPFDLIYERTFLCAMPPDRWKNYAARMSDLLQPGGKLVGFFFYGPEPEPPPFPLSKAEALDLFGKDFLLVNSQSVNDSLPLFKGKERWQEWQKKAIGD